MDDHKPKLYARLRVKTGEYESDGKTKNRYSDVGVLFASPHFNNMYMQIETLPIGNSWDGRIYVNPVEKDNLNRPLTQHEVLNQVDLGSKSKDESIDLKDIPF